LVEQGTVKKEIEQSKMKAYSVDLRQKIIDAHNQQEGSQRQLAKRFRVSLSNIYEFVKALSHRWNS
jgi:transposase